jgi:hypothetical protein
MVPLIVVFHGCRYGDSVGPIVDDHLSHGHRKWTACGETTVEDSRGLRSVLLICPYTFEDVLKIRIQVCGQISMGYVSKSSLRTYHWAQH